MTDNREELLALDWPNEPFRFHDDPGEHNPCYVVMPGGAMLPLNHHAREGVDIARAKFIVDACNASLRGDAERWKGIAATEHAGRERMGELAAARLSAPAGNVGVTMLRECLQSIADMPQDEPREPDDADWRFRCLSAVEAAKNTLAAQPREALAEEIKRADAAPPEASFDNASDMLGYLNAPAREAKPVARSYPETAEALRLLAAEDVRQSKLHDLLETIREQIRLEVKPEHRPTGLFQNIQDAVYAMRGRTLLMNDVAITAPLSSGVAQAPMRADIAQMIDAGWKTGKSSSEVAEEILREFDASTVSSTEGK